MLGKGQECFIQFVMKHDSYTGMPTLTSSNHLSHWFTKESRWSPNGSELPYGSDIPTYSEGQTLLSRDFGGSRVLYIYAFCRHWFWFFCGKMHASSCGWNGVKNAAFKLRVVQLLRNVYAVWLFCLNDSQNLVYKGQ